MLSIKNNKALIQITRNLSKLSNSNIEFSENFQNRNPRNLERMRIGYKPDGFHVDALGKRFWHKLILRTSARNVTASIEHFENGTVLQASSSEWAIKKNLYKTNDTSAYVNVGRVLADRCLKAGLTEVDCHITPPRPDGKVALFLQALQDGGVKLEEPPQYKPDRPWNLDRPEKPWEVTE